MGAISLTDMIFERPSHSSADLRSNATAGMRVSVWVSNAMLAGLAGRTRIVNGRELGRYTPTHAEYIFLTKAPKQQDTSRLEVEADDSGETIPRWDACGTRDIKYLMCLIYLCT